MTNSDVCASCLSFDTAVIKLALLSEDIAWGLAQDGLLLGVIEHIIVAQMCAQLEKV